MPVSMKFVLVGFSAFILSANAFAVSPQCEHALATAEQKIKETNNETEKGVQQGEISNADAKIYKRNSGLLRLQAQAFCWSIGSDLPDAIQDDEAAQQN